ncbi:MAG: hypothetical protein PHS37_05190 [Candidatus Omnitrophica bacterium]|nr:hypothetical protein [Candidatus Omnitrophota bacterium]
MIEINLLPKDLRVKEIKSPDLGDMPIIPIGIGVLALMFVIHITLIAVNSVFDGSYVKLKSRWDGFAPEKKKLDTLNGRLKDLDAKVKTIEELTANRVLWAEFFDGLSNATLANVWYSSFSFDGMAEGGTLALDGFATGPSEVATASVGRLINALKDEKKISKYVDRIDLESVQEAKIGQEEVMRFRLLCVLMKRSDVKQ